MISYKIAIMTQSLKTGLSEMDNAYGEKKTGESSIKSVNNKRLTQSENKTLFFLS